MTNEKYTGSLLEKDTRAGTALNYAFLRAKGLELVQQYSGDTWTDYNLHDPGVTILEALCYALTDLAYRTKFPMEDILTTRSGKINREKNLFFTPAEIFCTNPVTVNDFRKLVIDNVPELYNVWLEPVLSAARMQYAKGVYRVVMQLSDQVLRQLEAEQDEREVKKMENAVIEKVKDVLHSHRNLGEDFEEFVLLEPCRVEVQADISILRNELPEDVLAEIYSVLSRTLNPELKFCSEQELLSRGYTAATIYEGPLLKHGFIADEDLRPRTGFIDPADLLKAITSVPGVALVQHLSIKVNDVEYDNRVCRLADNEFPHFVFDPQNPGIRLYNDQYEIPVKRNLFFSLFAKKAESDNRQYILQNTGAGEEFAGKGVYRNLQEYFSVQHLFPVVYKLGIRGFDTTTLDNDESVSNDKQRFAYAKQLKAYLMFFEQLMANYLSQLTNTDSIFSSAVDDSDGHSYFSQPLYSVPGIENMLKAFFDGTGLPPNSNSWKSFTEDPDNGYASMLSNSIESRETYLNRKNRVLDHMLARFNCLPQKYPLEVFIQTYGSQKNDEGASAELLWKSGLLKNILTLSQNRNLAFNYYKKETEWKRSGFEERIAGLLFIRDIKDRPLANMTGEHDKSLSIQTDSGSTGNANDLVKINRLVWQNEVFDITDENGLLIKSSMQKGKDQPAPALKKMRTEFLKNGLDTTNYRIVPENGESGDHLLIYRAPGKTSWDIAGRFANADEASDALNELIKHLSKISIASEGFHMVEHLLLKPPLGSRFYGFNILDDKGHVLLKQNDWLSFTEREKVIKTITDLGKHPFNGDYAALARYLEGLCEINLQHDEEAEHEKEHAGQFTRPSMALYAARQNRDDVERIFRRLIRNLRLMNQPGKLLYPGIQSTVRMTANSSIPEDFFNLRLTVVFPSWPARFQEGSFRRFAEQLFLENCPAGVRLQFKWLGISAMKAFEDIYFKWREAMNDYKFSQSCIEDAGELSSLLYGWMK